MTSGEDMLLRPVLRGMCKYESLLDGKIRLIDIVKMNEAIDVEAENLRRLEKK
jgi:hypothetical protein